MGTLFREHPVVVSVNVLSVFAKIYGLTSVIFTFYTKITNSLVYKFIKSKFTVHLYMTQERYYVMIITS